MATLGGVNGGSLVPDMSSGLNMVLQQFGAMKARDKADGQNQEANDIAQSLPDLNSKDQEKAFIRLAAINPEFEKSMRGIMERGDAAEIESAKLEAEKGLKQSYFIANQPNYQAKINAITSMAQEASARGESLDRFIQLANMPEPQLDLELQKMQVMGSDIKTLTEPKKAPAIREIKQGDKLITQQFNSQSGQFEDIAASDRFQSDVLSPEAFAQKQQLRPEQNIYTGDGQGSPNIVTPPALLEGLPEATAKKVDATFRAAGGGKDGIDSINKVMSDFDEQERRALVPNILTNSFPNASPAERAQLDAAMSAAKDTDTGLAKAQEVRTEQRRLKKASSFQDRAVKLLSGIINNPQVGDVTGSIEGAYDSRLSDSESELIADINEAQNILTADNLSLMTGVLSETDMGIIRSLAGGALNRKRGAKRFIGDVTELKNRLASKKVQTVDQLAGETIGRFNVKVK